jgi:hypothetical protein
MAHHDHAADGSPDNQYLETPPEAGYEHTDVDVWIIVKFLCWLAVSAVIIHVGLGMLYQVLIQQSMETGQQPYPLAAAQEQRLPPTPRLQQFPANERYQFRLGEENLLQSYGWMNRDAGIVHIPISEAMRLTLEREVLTSAPPQDPGARPAAAPGFMPADASSGRTLERRGR